MTLQSVDEALDVLAGDPDPAYRQSAVRYLIDHPETAIPRCIRLADSEFSSDTESTIAAFVGAAALGIAGFFLAASGGKALSSRGALIALLALGAVACMKQLKLLIAYQGQEARALEHSRRVQARRLLSEWEDIRAIAPICTTLDSITPSYFVPALQEELLTRLLPLVTVADFGLLSPSHRLRLYALLQIDNAVQHAELLIAILRALEQIGDAQAIPSVRALAEAAVTTVNGTRVRTAARRCLPILLQREAAADQGRSLLRASDAPVVETNLLRPVEPSEGILLRPSGGTGATEPDRLLRSTDGTHGATE